MFVTAFMTPGAFGPIQAISPSRPSLLDLYAYKALVGPAFFKEASAVGLTSLTFCSKAQHHCAVPWMTHAAMKSSIYRDYHRLPSLEFRSVVLAAQVGSAGAGRWSGMLLFASGRYTVVGVG